MDRLDIFEQVMESTPPGPRKIDTLIRFLAEDEPVLAAAIRYGLTEESGWTKPGSPARTFPLYSLGG